MTTSSVAERKEKKVARPLSVIIKLVKGLLKDAERAADDARNPYHREIGELFAEARGQFATYAEFLSWTHRSFGFGETHSRRLLSLGRTNRNRGPQEPLFDNVHQHRVDQGMRQNVYPQPWHEPIKNIIGKVDVETLNLQKAELKRVEEREAERKLALQLIDIGYKALATKLHPDKGGSRDAMARLNHVRERLKAHA